MGCRLCREYFGFFWGRRRCSGRVVLVGVGGRGSCYIKFLLNRNFSRLFGVGLGVRRVFSTFGGFAV